MAWFLDFALLTLSYCFVLVTFSEVILKVLFVEFDLYVAVIIGVGLRLAVFIDFFSRERFGSLIRSQVVRDVDVNILMGVKHMLSIIKVKF